MWGEGGRLEGAAPGLTDSCDSSIILSVVLSEKHKHNIHCGRCARLTEGRVGLFALRPLTDDENYNDTLYRRAVSPRTQKREMSFVCYFFILISNRLARSEI